MSKLKWAYGVTTVPCRMHDLLPRTLLSLLKAGFDRPRLFIDGEREPNTGRDRVVNHYECTWRGENIRTFGNWVLAAWELYIRTPTADRYCIFQDDFITYPNLKDYLESCEYQPKSYYNLYTFPHNEGELGWHHSDQNGRGAVALMFDGEALRTLLSQRMFINRPLHPNRGHKCVDGGIVDCLKVPEVGYTELVHTPSLVQHVGLFSSMGNRSHQQAISFRGESFNAKELIKCPVGSE